MDILYTKDGGKEYPAYWNGDGHIARVIHQTLTNLADNNHGCPTYGKYADTEHPFKEYEEDIRRVAAVFKQYLDDQFQFKEEEIKDWDWAFDWLKEYFGSLWD